MPKVRQIGCLSFLVYAIVRSNKSVKGTRRPLAVLEFGFLSRFGGFGLAFVSGTPLTNTLGSVILGQFSAVVLLKACGG